MRALLVLGAALVLGASTSATGLAAPSACSATPAAVIQLQDAGPAPDAATAQVGEEIDFVNGTAASLTVATSLDNGTPVAVDPGACLAVAGPAGDYGFTVGGYASGDQFGWLHFTVPPSVTISQHASILYGDRTTLSGTALGPAGEHLVLWARPLGSTERFEAGSVLPFNGEWQVSVAPKVGTEYTASFAGASDQRVLRVRMELRLRRIAHGAVATVVPRSGHSAALLFRYTPTRDMLWSGYRSARIDAAGVARFRNLPPGRYYVAVLGGDRYLDTASEPFQVRS